MKRYLKSILPTFAQWVSFLILPTLLTIYLLVSKYSDLFVRTQGIDYVAVQNNFLARLYITGAFADFFTRFMDFAFWGILATIGVLIFWGVSVAKTSVENHKTETTFINLDSSTISWHEHYIIIVGIKLLLGVVFLYSLISMVSNAIPRLATGIALLVQSISVASIIAAIIGFLLIVLHEAIIVISIRTFKLTKAD